MSDVDRVLDELTLEKSALASGVGFWHTVHSWSPTKPPYRTGLNIEIAFGSS